MNARIDYQVILGSDGKPAFVVLPWDQFRKMRGGLNRGAVPAAVVDRAFDQGVSPMQAWREHLKLTQAAVAERIGITQAAYAQMERSRRPRKATLEKVAIAFDIEVDQLSW